MRINAHTHIFNFRSVFSPATLKILANRLLREKWPDFMRDAVIKVLSKHLTGDLFDEETLLRALAKELNASDKLKDLLKNTGHALHPSVNVILEGDVDGLAAGALREIFGKLSDALIKADDDDARAGTVEDLIAFLAIGIKPTILHVANDLMRYSGPETIVVALMMDITEKDADDEKQFQRQLKDTSEAALAYPGRILPFVAVNSLRKAHYEHMVTALENFGFVGVKLYPSLGFRLDTAEMDKIFAYCEQNDVPILMHCNQGGFFLNEGTISYSTPEIWRDLILPRYPKLRICFGHFGGDENLTKAEIDPNSWTAIILELMDAYEGVYADISYHDDPMNGLEGEKNYFGNLKSLLVRPKVMGRILFGSDFFLVRQRVRDDNLWRYFESRFSKAEFEQLTDTNPQRYLGLPGGGKAPAPTIANHLSFLVKHRFEVRSLPVPWAAAAIKVQAGDIEFFPNEFGTGWTINNDAHWYTWQFFRTRMFPTDRETLTLGKAGHLRLRDLDKWYSEAMSKPNRPAALRKLANDLHLFLVQKDSPGAVLEKNVSPNSAQSAISKLLSNGDTILAEFGPAIDALYHFKREDNA
jgi:predicted TIM-barrel fold metal-dependent hydrolase